MAGACMAAACMAGPAWASVCTVQVCCLLDWNAIDGWGHPACQSEPACLICLLDHVP